MMSNGDSLALAQHANKGNTMNIFDFVQGQQDCKNGKPHEAGHSLDYDRGYATQYELEQANNEMRVRKCL